MKSLLICLLFACICMCYAEDPIPVFYDTRLVHKDCIEPARNQGKCTSSWAHAIASMMSERYCIAKKNRISFSAQSLISCSPNSKTCDGHFDKTEIEQTLTTKGVVTEDCLKYQENNAVECPAKCENGNEPVWQKCKSVISLDNEDAIKREILKNGPVVCFANMHTDFKDYMTGIYYYASARKETVLEGVKIIGWGWENGIFYWTGEVARGKDFGENGFARMKLSRNPSVKFMCEQAIACELE